MPPLARSVLCMIAVASIAMNTREPVRAGDWNRFRGPNGSAVSDAKDLPDQWDNTKNVAWKTPLPGPGSSSPIIVGDRVFLTCYSGYGTSRESAGKVSDLKRHLICISLDNGKILWDRSTPGKADEDRFTGFLRDHGYATSTPVSDGKQVFVFYGKSGVLAYDLEGNELWQTDVGNGSAKNNWGSGSSPVLHGDLVIVNAAAESKAVVAFDKKTGKEAWRSNAPNIYGSWSTPVLVEAGDKTELVLSAPYELWGFDPISGDFLWYADGIGDETICGSIVARDGIIYAVGGRGGSAVAVRAGGRDEVTGTRTLWKKQLSSYVPSPVLVGDKIFCVNERGVLGCLSVQTGESLLQKRLPDAGGIYASPVAADGKLFIVTRRNGTIVLSDSGDVLSQNKLDDETDFNASPAITDGKLLLRSNDALYCISTSKK